MSAVLPPRTISLRLAGCWSSISTTCRTSGTRIFAHVALVNGRYAGFALVAPAHVTQTDGYWMEQFFILKKYRHGGNGLALATHVLDCHPGPWEIGQMPANVAARSFWRAVVSRLASGTFSEVQVTQGWWQGTVQRFVYAPAA
ncbi:MAG TPA: hypothetical protein VFR18_18255 [Terriglobia bacterium]|nr:hypothetical protein [Terriglobia bacterium]